MVEGMSETPSFPEVFFRWLETAQRFPMFDVWREGTLCSIKLVHILDLSPTDRNIFMHRLRLQGFFPSSFLPLGYDAFGNLLLWDMDSDEVYLHWRGTPPNRRLKVAPTLKSLCEKMYYRPIHG
ncbi:MAG: hypothetical protein N2253_00850 [Bacteroidia bacterium]|nr:hypothetical protein [Bacteroidia bacterium]MCX7763425.1 hypothetical protein [Bacteroidia bacterium]MDW8057590.1 hypothetical protein [Bacteroidia bacterium]